MTIGAVGKGFDGLEMTALEPYLHPHVLVMGECRRFTCGAAGHEPVAAFRDLPRDQLTESRFVNLSALHRGYERGDRTLEALADVVHA